MAIKTLNTIIQLRRDNDYNFEKIKSSFVPANGEIVLVDTSKGLRAKIGNGNSTYENLSFIDEISFGNVSNGYYQNGIFYEDSNKQKILQNITNKIYVDNSHSKIYYYDGNKYVNIQQTLTTASSIEPGCVKLYNEKGLNTDGTITQRLFTEEINKKFEVEISNNDEELLIFKITN